MHHHEDAGIAAKILHGDLELYAGLMNKYQQTIFALVAKRVPENEVLPLVHETFVQAYRSLAGYSGKVPFGNWAARIAIRTCCAYWRREYRHKKRSAGWPADEERRQWLEQLPDLNVNHSADCLTNRQDAVMLAEWLLGQLSPENRTLIESVYFDDLPLKEVAAALGWSLVKTKVRALRARQKMRELLKSIGESL
ncbi:MAG: RNA polymerase sigma factor [Victivallaceae bacterium]|nr:RNA polymerase sigma factor [Victivallaceae bacterium]